MKNVDISPTTTVALFFIPLSPPEANSQYSNEPGYTRSYSTSKPAWDNHENKTSSGLHTAFRTTTFILPVNCKTSKPI